MKTIQKLEFLAGFATFVAGLSSVYYVAYPGAKGLAELNREPFVYDWMRDFLSMILPTLLIAVSSCFHAFKRSYIELDYVGLFIIIVLGGILSFSTLIGWLLGNAFEGQRYIGVAPGFFAFITVILALINIFELSGKRI